MIQDKMSSVFNISGKTRVYNIDGTGRDTYIGFNNGGNTLKYEPRNQERHGPMVQTAGKFNFNFPKQRSAAVKNVHYHSDGTGRDSYVHVGQGGYMNNYKVGTGSIHHKESLRSYQQSIGGQQFQVYQQSRKLPGISPKKDHFVEGQCSIRSPAQRAGIQAMRGYQNDSVQRLSVPRTSKTNLLAHTGSYGDMSNSALSPFKRDEFLKKEMLRNTRQGNFTPKYAAIDNVALIRSGGLQLCPDDGDSPRMQRQVQRASHLGNRNTTQSLVPLDADSRNRASNLLAARTHDSLKKSVRTGNRYQIGQSRRNTTINVGKLEI